MGKNLNSSPFLRGLEGDLFNAPNTVAAAQMVADRMRKMVAETDMRLRGAATTSPQRVTVSIGVATLVDGEGGDELLRRADEALYAAKNAGRNRIMIATAKATV